jgi:hypothetical protein
MNTSQDDRQTSAGLGTLQSLAEQYAGNRAAPVESWNPAVCNDIGLAIRRDGIWTVAGSPIGRAPLVRLFASILRRDADGSTWLVTPVEKVPVAVEDAPFLAVEMEVRGTGPDRRITVRTNVDDVVPVDLEHPLRFALDAADGGLKPYLRVRGRLDALFTRALYYDLVELAEPREGEDAERLGIWSAGVWSPLEAKI